MCSIILLIRPGHAWPVLAAANRDERIDRPWDAPARYWPERPDVIGGRDRLAGGTWLALNDAGVMAALLNRPGSLGPAAGKASRGDLPLIALEERSAEAAAGRIAALDAGRYRSFNMVIADAAGAIFLRGLEAGAPEPRRLEAGITMITAHDPNDTSSPRIARYLPLFRAASPPDPDRGDWDAWAGLLADRSSPAESALDIAPRDGFGTVCAALIALAPDTRRLLFAAGPPDSAPFEPIMD